MFVLMHMLYNCFLIPDMFKWSILFVTNIFVLPESFFHYVIIFRITLKKYPEVSVHIKEYCEVRITKDT